MLQPFIFCCYPCAIPLHRACFKDQPFRTKQHSPTTTPEKLLKTTCNLSKAFLLVLPHRYWLSRSWYCPSPVREERSNFVRLLLPRVMNFMFNNSTTELRLVQQKQVSQILGRTGHLWVVNNVSTENSLSAEEIPFFTSFLEGNVVKKFLSENPFTSWHSLEKLLNISMVSSG